jgi:hypothetical protein
MENRICNLIQKSRAIFDSELVDEREIIKLEKKLKVILCNDFKKMSIESNHEYSTVFSWIGFVEGILNETLQLRSEGMPHKYIILSDEGDGGAVFLETQDSPEKPSPVIWCDMEDVYNLCDTGEFKYNPTIWPSFTDFFEYLVDEEEKMQIAENRLDK